MNGAHPHPLGIGVGRFIREVGCSDIQQSVSLIDFSAGSAVNDAFTKNMLVTYELLQPFLIKMGMATQYELDLLLQEAVHDMLDDHFDGMIVNVRAWGRKPA